MTDPILIKQRNFFGREGDEIALRHDKLSSGRQLNREWLKPMGEALFEIVGNIFLALGCLVLSLNANVRAH